MHDLKHILNEEAYISFDYNVDPCFYNLDGMVIAQNMHVLSCTIGNLGTQFKIISFIWESRFQPALILNFYVQNIFLLNII